MISYPPFDPNAELNGSTTQSLIKNINYNGIENILIKHHLNAIDPTQWYHLQSVLDVLAEISDNINGTENLVAIGMAAARIALANIPAALANLTLEQWLRTYCETIYPTRQRNGYCGEMSLRTESANHMILTMYSPYPDDLMYGLFYSYIKHFTPPGMRFVLRYDETSLRRGQGGPHTIYHIRGFPVTAL